jgi:CubicO group peptidase (beta-lactamase class C family)
VTAATAVALIDEGVLRLDQPIDDLVPELANRRVLRAVRAELDDTLPARRPITVEDLGELMRERIFDPLGMSDTGFFVPEFAEAVSRSPVRRRAVCVPEFSEEPVTGREATSWRRRCLSAAPERAPEGDRRPSVRRLS